MSRQTAAILGGKQGYQMIKDDFLKLLNNNAPVVAELLGVTKPAVYAWRKNGLPHYWWGAVHNLTDEQVQKAVEKINNRKLANAMKRGRK